MLEFGYRNRCLELESKWRYVSDGREFARIDLHPYFVHVDHRDGSQSHLRRHCEESRALLDQPGEEIDPMCRRDSE